MSITDNEYEIVIKNKKIYEYYNQNKNISVESANLLLIDFLDSMFNHVTDGQKTNVNAQLLSYINENKNQMDNIKTNIHIMNDNILKLNNEITNKMTLQFMTLKKEYIDDVKEIISNNTLTTNEKICSLMDKNNNHLIDKTTLIINDVIPKNQDNLTKQMQISLKQLYNMVSEDTNKLAKSLNNEKSMQDFISAFDTKYNAMMQNVQQPLYSFFTASENRINQNIDVLKESASTSLVSQNKLFDDLGEFLDKYKGSSNKGKFGEHNLCSILNNVYQNAEITDTTGVKSSGDFIMKRLDKPTILFENKEYKNNIDKDEVGKFITDVDKQNVSGVFISQYSGITFKQNYQIDIHKGNVLIYIQNCEYNPDKIRIAVDIIDSLYFKIQDYNLDDENNTISKEILDDINNEYQSFIVQKDALNSVLKDFQKKMTQSIEDLKLPVLDKYLEPKYAFIKSRSFICDMCNSFTASSKQSLSAHKRGCKKKNCLTIS
jgi:hypothetical protein